MTRLAGVILTYNEAGHIIACIESLAWADEVVVFDSFSRDETVTLAERAGARVIQHRFENYGAQRDAALNALDAEWVFFLDADERATPALGAEVRTKLNQPERAWRAPRHNYIFGKLTKGAGWYPDYQTRLLHRRSARYDPLRPVHEEVIVNGEVGTLQQPIIHYNYRDVAHFHAKQQRYSRVEARIRTQQGYSPKPWTPITGALRHFWWRFVTLEGWRDGAHGLHLSLLMAYYEFKVWVQVGEGAAPSAEQPHS